MFDFIKDNFFLWVMLLVLIASPSLFFGFMWFLLFIVLGVIVLMMVVGWLIRRKIEKLRRESGMYGDAEPFGGSSSKGRSSRGEPRVRVVVTDDDTAATDKKVSHKVGDYVDFEEIKE